MDKPGECKKCPTE